MQLNREILHCTNDGSWDLPIYGSNKKNNRERLENTHSMCYHTLQSSARSCQFEMAQTIMVMWNWGLPINFMIPQIQGSFGACISFSM